MDLISEDRFMTDYNPVELANEGEFVMERFEDALAMAQKAGGGISNVWTIVHVDDTNSSYAAAGFHKVNEMGFLVTEKAWETGIEEAVWFEDDYEEESVWPEDDVEAVA